MYVCRATLHTWTRNASMASRYCPSSTFTTYLCRSVHVHLKRNFESCFGNAMRGINVVEGAALPCCLILEQTCSCGISALKHVLISGYPSLQYTAALIRTIGIPGQRRLQARVLSAACAYRLARRVVKQWDVCI